MAAWNVAAWNMADAVHWYWFIVLPKRNLLKY